MSAIKRAVLNGWGLSFRTMEIIYKRVFISIAEYASANWSDSMTATDIRKLKTAQKQALLTLKRAYVTVATSMLCINSGQMPVGIYLQKRAAMYHARKGNRVQLGPSENQ